MTSSAETSKPCRSISSSFFLQVKVHAYVGIVTKAVGVASTVVNLKMTGKPTGSREANIEIGRRTVMLSKVSPSLLPIETACAGLFKT